MNPEFTVKICWGAYDQRGGWHHNPALSMTAVEQYTRNFDKREDTRATTTN